MAAAGMRAMCGIAPAGEERQVTGAGVDVRASRSAVVRRLSSVRKLRIIYSMRNGGRGPKST